MFAKRFENFENFIFDLDGTVWHWIRLIKDVNRVFKGLENSDKNVYFLTNNCVLSRSGFAKKLTNFGIETKTEQIINPSLSAAKLLKGNRVFCIGEGIKDDLKKAKVRITRNANAVLVAEDRKLTFDKIVIASNLIHKKTEFYKTARAGLWRMGKNMLPGTGAIAATIELTIGREAELIGKPSNHMVDVIKKYKLNPKKSVLFGDECKSDVIIGNKLNFFTVLVLTGYCSIEDYYAAKGLEKPDMVLKSIADIVKR